MCSMCSTKSSDEDVDVVLQRNSTPRRLRSAVESTFFFLFFSQTSNNKKKNKENSH